MRTLVSYLNERSPQELRSIAEHWEANQTERLLPGHTFELSQEMSSEFLQRRLIEKLSPTQLQTLLFFIKQPNNSASYDDLASALEISKLEATELIVALSTFGLLFTTKFNDSSNLGYYSKINGIQRLKPLSTKQDQVVLPRELARPLRRLVSEMLFEDSSRLPIKISHLPLRELLNRLEPEVIESQAEIWGLSSLIGSHEIKEISDELARVLTDQNAQNRMFEHLDKDVLHLFERLREQNSTIPILIGEYVSLKRLGRSLRPLTERLLVWEAFENGQSVVFVPSEIRKPHASDVTIHKIALQTVNEITQGITPFPPYALVWDALTFLNYLGQNEVILTNQRYIPKRHAKKLLTLFWHSSEERYDFLVSLCQHLHLYSYDEENRLQPSSAELNEWLKLDFYAQMRLMFKEWMHYPYSGVIYFPYYYNSQAVISKAYQTMLSWLQQCEPDVWYSLDSLLNKVQHEDPFFIKSRKELINQFGLRQVDEMSRQWNKIEAEIIRNAFGTIFEWFGIVRVSRDPLMNVEAFSLTQFGAEICGLQNAPLQIIPLVEKPILVQPNFEVLLLSPQVKALWSLLKFGYLRRLDQVSIFVIDRISVLRGMESGFTTTAILEWLQSYNPQPLPQNVQVSVEDWGKDFKRVTVEQTVLLETDDPKVLDELMISSKYAQYFVRRLSPNAAVVKLPTSGNTTSSNFTSRVDHLKNFRNLLKSGGFFAR